jgi:lysine decarboxylase
MFNYLQSTSPSNILLASLDATRRMMWRRGRESFAAAIEHTEALRHKIKEIPGLQALSLDSSPLLADYKLDPFRLVVNFTALGLSSFTAARVLANQFGIECELCDGYNVILILSPQEHEMYDDLLAAFRALSSGNFASNPIKASAFKPIPYDAPLPVVGMSPRDTVFSKKVSVPIKETQGRICGETVTPYPPGIPILCPGEVVSQEIINLCLTLKQQGANVYASDLSLENIVVVDP